MYKWNPDGWLAGPKSLTNRQVLGLVSQAQLAQLAVEYKTFQGFSGSVEELLEFLHDTAKATADNINSLSLNWQRGKPEMAYYFKDLFVKDQKNFSVDFRAWSALFEREVCIGRS